MREQFFSSLAALGIAFAPAFLKFAEVFDDRPDKVDVDVSAEVKCIKKDVAPVHERFKGRNDIEARLDGGSVVQPIKVRDNWIEIVYVGADGLVDTGWLVQSYLGKCDPEIEEFIDDDDVEIPAYVRKHWRHWIDADGDCQDTRQEVLIEESLIPVEFMDAKKCRVKSGLWEDPYSGETFTDPKDLQIDHMVPLKNAHLSGAWAWDAKQRKEYANYMDAPEHLIAVKGRENSRKGDRGPEAYKPPNQSYWCQYARDWTAIKKAWQLEMTVSEAKAVEEMLTTCP